MVDIPKRPIAEQVQKPCGVCADVFDLPAKAFSQTPLKHPAKLTLSISIRPNRRWALLAIIAKSYSNAFQISVAYSRIVRSDENQPMRAVFNTAERHQA